jgi:hypothetical protein
MNAVVQPLEPQQNRMQLQFDAQTCGVEISRVSYCGQTNFWPSQQIPAGLPFGMIKLSPIADDDPLPAQLNFVVGIGNRHRVVIGPIPHH